MDGSRPWDGWTHVVRLDPDTELPAETYADVCGSGTNTVFVGDTTDVTIESARD